MCFLSNQNAWYHIRLEKFEGNVKSICILTVWGVTAIGRILKKIIIFSEALGQKQRIVQEMLYSNMMHPLDPRITALESLLNKLLIMGSG